MKKISAEEHMKLLDFFLEHIAPWCRENQYSLHQAFEASRKQDKEKYQVLSDLWHTPSGKAYLKSAFRGGRLRQKEGE